MEKIIKFYEENDKYLINYNKEHLDELYKLIKNERNTWNNNLWLNDCLNTIAKFMEIFTTIPFKYIDDVECYINKLSNCVQNDDFTKNLENVYIVKKIKLYIQFLHYLKKIYYVKKITFDKEKYDIIFYTYNIFCNFKNEMKELFVEYYSEDYIFFYSKSINYVNICIYQINELFGYKIYLSYRKEIETNKIKICTFDVIINTQHDFYNNFEKSSIILSKYTKYTKNSLQHIDVKQIGECFLMDMSNVKIEFNESTFIKEQKMLSFVKTFLDN
jgi:hypothetical protein